MELMGFAVSGPELILCTTVVTYLFLSRFCPFILAWLIQFKYKCSITIGRIGLPYVALHNVCLKTNDFFVLIDRVGFTSSLVNSDAPKLLSVIIGTISLARISKSRSVPGNVGRVSNTGVRKKLKAPAFISNLVQFLGIQINEIKIWGWEKIDENKGLHCNLRVGSISVDGCTTVGGTNICACIVINLEKVEVRFSENWLPDEMDLVEPIRSEYFHGSSGLKFLEGNFDFRLNLIFSARNSGEFIDHFSIDVEKLSLSWELKEKSLNSIKKLVNSKSMNSENVTDIRSVSWIERIEDTILSQCVPKEIKFRIFETECQISDEDSKTDFESKISGFSFASRCFVVNVNGAEMVSFESQLDLGLIRIEPDPHQYFSIDQFSNYIKLAKHNLTVDLDISNFSLKSYEKCLLFAKSRFMLNLILAHQFPRRDFKFSEVFESLDKITFGTSELDIQYNEKSGSVSSAFLEAHCKDLNRIWTEDNCSIEIVIKNLNTIMNYSEEGIYRPIAFDLMGFHLQREQIGAKLSGSRLQWVPRIEKMLKHIIAISSNGNLEQTKKKEPMTNNDKPLLGYLKGVNIEIFDSKVIYMASNNLCLNADLGSLTTTSDRKVRTINVERFEVFSSSTFSDCTLNPLFTIPRCDIIAQMGQCRRYEFSMKSDTVIYWSPFLHKQLMHFGSRVKKLISRFSPKQARKDSVDLNSNITQTMCFRFKKNFCLIAKLAKNHAVEISLDKWTIEKGPNHFDWTSQTTTFKFDGIQIGHFQKFQVSKNQKHSSLTRSQRKTARLSQPENITWLVNVERTTLTFPFGYNFASAFNEEFVTCFKWLKKLHSTPSKGLPVPWSDLFMKFQTIRIEVGDDPFEVKLRDNFELLEDEYFESLKRNQVLDTKINQLYKTNFLMSSSKIDELRKQLLEKSSAIYIQRSKQLYKNHALRTHLLLWELAEVQITSMADPTMCHPDQLKKILRELDPESPWPLDDLEFTTLWCRCVCFDVNKWSVQLRDFPQPLMDSSNIHFWGTLAAGELVATRRGLRTCEIEIGGPFESEFIQRSLSGLKWYYDLNCDVECLSFAFGPCWEPVLAQCNLAFENIFPPPRDPSRPLPFWDKIRLLFHGRLYMAVDTLTHFLHASLNPYNTTEEMEVTWTDVAIAWTNGKIIFDGDLDIYVRTASKYDDCRMIHLPSVRLTFKLYWVCLADANDHHVVQPCAPDKLPEYSSNQEHDSYRAFRSQNLNMNISLDTKSQAGKPNVTFPTAILYGSTLRWFENLKLILSGTTRPTRRGVLFRNTRNKKIPISRHYKKIRLSVSLNRFHVCYWVSFSMQSGVEVICGKLSSSSEHMLALQLINDGLIHRPKADWSVLYVNSEVNETEIWLQSSLPQESNNEVTLSKSIEKFFFMSIDKFSYGREALLVPVGDDAEGNKTDTPQHRLVVHELKGAWTSSNRDVAFALFDSFVKVQQLKKNLSTEALKSFFSKHDGPTGSPVKKGNGDSKKSRGSEVTSPNTSGQSQKSHLGSSPLTNLQGPNAAASLLEKLISEAESRGVVFSEDLTAPPPQQSLHGVAQSSLDDVIHQKWLIELVNCQVLLKGCETRGYVIVSAAKAHILQKEHKPVWKHGTIVPKTTWVGASEGMQYYATVSAGSTDTPEENIQWVSVENIEERNTTTISNVPDMVGSGQSVGGVVSETVGESSDDSDLSIQLQRIISRCKCEFFYTTYGETGVDKIPSGIPDIPPAPRDLEPWDDGNKPVEAFTLMHDDLNMFSNSLQFQLNVLIHAERPNPEYAMIMDIVNNLVLYVDPKRKEGFEKLQRLRFKLQLQSTEAQRRPIQQLQNHLRALVNQLRRLEKETYSIHKSVLEDPNNEILRSQRSALEQQVNECKESVAAKGEELHMMIMCYKEAKLAATQRLSRKRDNKDVSLVRVYEICFKHAKWRLTQTDGQLGIADLALSNFLYTKTAKSDDSIEHLSELGYITVTNLLPNQIYKEVLTPSYIHASMPIDRQRTLRVFCRDRPPVGGIAVKEHFEINIAPITIGMTYQFFKTLFKFCFPEKDPEKLDEVDANTLDVEGGGGPSGGTGTMDSQLSAALSSASSSMTMTLPTPNSKSKKSRAVKKKESKFYVAMSEKDDVEKMKERAEKNMLFICVKIPEVPVRVSYKGEKEKNIEDVHDVHLIIPTLEYNNITWTWLDFLVAVRNHSKRVLLSQAIKQKLQIWPKVWSDSGIGPQEEDKAKMLLGLPVQVESKSLKKSLFGTKK